MVDWSGQLLRGKYEVGALLGEGGMGAVYEARNVRVGRRVAIKVLARSRAADPALLERFRREAEITASLEHPHILAVYDLCLEDEPAFIVMERLEGRSLLDLLREEGALEPGRVLRLTLQLLSGLGAAHAAGVVHRDLKPSNLFVTRGYDGGEVLEILDFGVARLLPSTGADPITQTGQVLGTLDHMAPEQAIGAHVDARADLYAVGTIMWSALVGRGPFRGDNPAMVLHHVLMGCDEPLSRIRPELGELAAVVDRAMSVVPDARYADADEMADALRAVDVTALAHLPARATSPRASASRPAAPVAPTAASTPSALAARATGRGVASPIRDHPPTRWPWLLAAAVLIGAVATGLAAWASGLVGGARAGPSDVVAMGPVDPAPASDTTQVPDVTTPTTPVPSTLVRLDAASLAKPLDAGTRAAVGEERRSRRARATKATPMRPAKAPAGSTATCRGYLATYAGVTGRMGAARAWARFRDYAYFAINRTCFPESRLGHFDLRLEVDEHDRVTSARVADRAPTVTAAEARCVERLTQRSGLHFDGPDTVIFHDLRLRCNDD